METWKEFKRWVKEARILGDTLNKKYKRMNWVQIQICFNKQNKEHVVLINPYCVNLKTGSYGGSEHCLITGGFVSIPNLKTIFT